MKAHRSRLSPLGLIVLCGCGFGTEKTPGSTGAGERFKGVRLSAVSLVDGGILAPLKALCAEWEAGQGAVVSLSANEGISQAADKADLVIFPGEFVGDLVAAGALQQLPARNSPRTGELDQSGDGTESRDEAAQDVAPAYRDQVTRYGERRIGLALGGTALVLICRRDVFHRESLRTEAEKTGVKLEPPRTWRQLDALAKFLDGRDWNGDGTPDHGIAFPFGHDPDGVSTSLLLARAAAYGQHPDHLSFLFDSDTMEPRLDQPPFVEALRDLFALRALGPGGVSEMTANSARDAYREGRAALLIDRAERVVRWTDPKSPIESTIAPLPGAERVFDPQRLVWQSLEKPNYVAYLPCAGGWLVGLSSKCSDANRAAALELSEFLAGPTGAREFALNSAAPSLSVRMSLLSAGLPDPRSALGVDSPSWARAVTATLSTHRVVVGLRIPGATEYLGDLDDAQANVLAGAKPDDALRAAKAAWAQRTAKLGLKRQLWHYRNSLNQLATGSTPPSE